MDRRHASLVVVLILAWTVAAHAVALRYKFSPGETLQYQTKLGGQGTITAMGRTDPVTMSGWLVHQQSVRSVDRAGRATLVVSVPRSSLQATWAGQALPANVSIPPMTLVVTPTGQIVSSQVQQAAGGADAGQLGQLLGGAGGLGALGADPTGFDFGKFMASVENLGFPAGDVQPGQSWTDQTVVNSPNGQQITIKSSSRLAGFSSYAGRQCAQITTTYSLPLTLSLPFLADMVQMTGSQTGNNQTFFDLAAGHPLHSQGTVVSRMTLRAPDLGNGQATEVSIRANLNVQTDLMSRPVQ